MIETLREALHALTPPEIHERAQRQHSRLGIATVYRALHALVEAGELTEVRLPGESCVRYELAAKPHHHHFRCQTCNRLFDLPGCVPLTKLMPPGFRMLRHDIVLYGLCAQCAN